MSWTNFKNKKIFIMGENQIKAIGLRFKSSTLLLSKVHCSTHLFKNGSNLAFPPTVTGLTWPCHVARHVTQFCHVACHVTQWAYSLSIIGWRGGWRGRPHGKTGWRGMVKSNLTVKPVKVDGNARFEPFLKRCVLHLSHRILVYVGWTVGNRRVLNLTLNPINHRLWSYFLVICNN